MKKLLIKYTGADEASLFWEVPYNEPKQGNVCSRVTFPDLKAEKLERLGRYLRLAEGDYKPQGEEAMSVASWIAKELKEIHPFLNRFKHIELELPAEFAYELNLRTTSYPHKTSSN